jgi:thiol-disulfide isomerase/thioredoxin
LENISSSRKGMTLAALMLLLSLAQISWAGDWNLKGIDGMHYTLSGLHGKWVLVNFWAPWCPPCLQEMPDLNASQQQHKDLQVIGVAVMYVSRKKVIDVVNKQSISYPIVFGNEDTAGDFGGLDGLPTSFLYTPSGKLVGHHQGILTQSDLDQAMAQNPDATILFTR